MNCERDSVQKGKQHQSIFVKPKEMIGQLYITTTRPPLPGKESFTPSLPTRLGALASNLYEKAQNDPVPFDP
jgi:hypothetical protein